MWPAAPQEHKPAGPDGEQIRRRLHQDGSGQLPPQEPACGRSDAAKDTRLRERAQSHCPGVTKLARERAKKANLHNRKLRDCRYHLSDGKGKDQETESCIFITEGDSASGSITRAATRIPKQYSACAVNR